MGPPPTQTRTGYYATQMAYGMMPGGHPPLASIQIPPDYQQPQQKSNGGKRNNNENNRGGQRRCPNNYQGGGRGGGYRGDHRNTNNTKKAYSNALKQHMNLLCCFSCGYDVDHDENNFPPSCKKKSTCLMSKVMKPTCTKVHACTRSTKRCRVEREQDVDG